MALAAGNTKDRLGREALPIPLPAAELFGRGAAALLRALDQAKGLAAVGQAQAQALLPLLFSAVRPAPVTAALAFRAPSQAASDWQDYLIDAGQRALLFWDIMREAGNNFVAHEEAGCPPVLVFRYETVLDGRSLPRPVNYALVRILPESDMAEPGMAVPDPALRPFVIIDPRAGHGAGIGGFKSDSQVGVALRRGHPVYFVIFFRDPVAGQTILDVTAAEAAFLRQVAALHPAAPKPVVIGNCQGGWATMMLGAAAPDEVGALVLNGAPLSYWAGERGAEPDALSRRPRRRLLALAAAGRSRQRAVRRRQPRDELRGPLPGRDMVPQVLRRVRQRRYRRPALPRVRALVGRVLPDERGGDPLDRLQPFHWQPLLRRPPGRGGGPRLQHL
jgi:pimeloyl-ACP methyl ester carboxylesterase